MLRVCLGELHFKKFGFVRASSIQTGLAQRALALNFFLKLNVSFMKITKRLKGCFTNNIFIPSHEVT